jgi:hypothetical protein
MLAMQAPPKPLPEAASAADAAAATAQQQQLLATQADGTSTGASAGASPTATPASTSGTAATAAAATAQLAASTPAPAAAKPLVLLLDVNLEAPVLLMPLNSTSDDLIELDLGELQLSNLVVWEMRCEDKDRQKLLVDEMQVCGACLSVQASIMYTIVCTWSHDTVMIVTS